MIRVDIETIIMASGAVPSTIVLRERSGETSAAPQRALTIQTGSYEAASISRGIDGSPSNRPITHDLFANTLDALGVKLERVEIVRVDAPVFYSKIVLTRSAGDPGMNGQPSAEELSVDALALAVRVNAPIYVEDDVMNRAGTISYHRDDQQEQREIEQFDRFVQTLSPDDF